MELACEMQQRQMEQEKGRHTIYNVAAFISCTDFLEINRPLLLRSHRS